MTTLRTIRSRLGWTQERLAKELGIPRSTLADAERGAATVSKARRWEIMSAANRVLLYGARPNKRRKVKVYKHKNGDVLMLAEGLSVEKIKRVCPIIRAFGAGILAGIVIGIGLCAAFLPSCYLPF